MKHHARIQAPAILAALAFLLAGCGGAPGEAAPVAELVARQQEAMIAADPEAMLLTIAPGDAWYRAEAAHLILDQRTAPVEDYALRVVSARRTGEGEWKATLAQSYTADGEKREGRFVHIFRTVGETLYDFGPDFERTVLGAVTVFHPSGYGDMAGALALVTRNYLSELEIGWDYAPSQGIAIKIYDDREEFLQSIKLTLPDWVGGWHEYGESIKIYASFRNPSPFESMMRHETTHTALSELTNDNAAYWMQEGFATLLETRGFAGILSPEVQDIGALAALRSGGRLPALAGHMAANPETYSDQMDIRGYYAYSNAMVVYLLGRFDADRLGELFAALREYEALPVTSAEKIAQTNERTAEAIRSVAGFDMGAGFEQWLDDLIG